MIQNVTYRVLCASVTMGLFLVVPPAAAQPGDTSPPQVVDTQQQVARQHLERGKELHRDGKYLEAAAEYQKAYDTLPLPAFLYNIGQAYRLAGDKEQALVNYKRYVALDPNGEAVADAREFIALLEKELSIKPAEGRAEGASTLGGANSSAGENDPFAAPMPERASSVPAFDVDEYGRSKRIAGLTMLSVGVVSLAASTYFAVQSVQISDELSQFEGTWGASQDERFAEGNRDRSLAIALTGVAAGAVIAGSITYYLGSLERRTAAQFAIAPSAGSGVTAFASFRF